MVITHNLLNFRIAHLNLRSIFTGFREFVDVTEVGKFDVVAVSETWLNSNTTSDMVAIRDYKFFRVDRSGGRGGGVGIYVKNCYCTELLPNQLLQNKDGFENLWIKIKTNKISVVIGVIYRTTNNALNCARLLDSFLPEILTMHDHVIILGDININMMPSNLPNAFSETFDILGFSQVINEPTRIAGRSATLLDPIFVSNSEVVVSSGTLDVENISDHKMTFCEIKLPSKKRPQKFVTYRDLKNLNEDLFYYDLLNTNWDEIFYIAGIDDKVHFLTHHLSSLFQKHAPPRTVRVNKPPAPWLTPALEALMRERDRALARCRTCKTQVNLDNYKRLRNLARYSLRREKQGYLEYLERLGNPKSMWKGFQQMHIFSGSRNTSAIPENLLSAEEINKYFLSVFQKTNDCRDRIYYYSNNKYKPDLNFSFNMESPDSILKYVNSIKSNAAGNDELTLFMIKLVLPILLLHVTHIVNCCLESGYFPTIWKESIVCPVPKVNNPSTINELRPISLLPVFSKILERAVHTQVTNYLKINNLFPVHQSGFREGHSTASALSNLLDNIIRALDKRMAVILISLDYSKAFDMLDPDLLCAKLQHLGFDELSVCFFYNYLTDRYQRVCVNNTSSSAGKIISGVPQGSIVGPLLFLIYTFDIFQTAQFAHIQTYADDTQLLYYFDPSNPAVAVERLNSDLNYIQRYSNEHNLKINPLKTQVLLFCSERRRVDLQTAMRLKLSDIDLQFVNCAKNLGLYLDIHLRFREHIKILLKKTYIKMKVLYSNRHILNFKMRKKLCETLILSTFNYCNIVYYPCLDVVTKNRLQYVQNICCRFVFKLRKYDHISEKINELKWLNINNTVNLHFVVFLMKIIKSSVPGYLKDKLVCRSAVHVRDIRSRYSLTMPQHQTALFQRCFTYMAVTHFNILDSDMKDCSMSTLRKKYKSYLLVQQIA